MSDTSSVLASRDHIRAIRDLIAKENGDRAFDVKTPAEQVAADFAFLSENPTAEKVELIVGLATVKYHSDRQAAAFRALVPAVKAGGETRAAAIAAYKTMLSNRDGASGEAKVLIELCKEDPSDELVGLIGTHVSYHGVYFPNNELMDALVEIGTKAAVEAIRNASEPRHGFGNDHARFNLYKSGLLKQVGTDEAAAAIATLVSDHDDVTQIRGHIENLIELGDIGFPYLEALAVKDFSPQRRDRWDRSEKASSLAFQAIQSIDTPRAREVEATVRGLFQGRIAEIESVFNAREAERAPYRHHSERNDEAPYEIRQECQELFAYSFADPDAALKVLAIGLAKSTLRPVVQSVMCDTVRQIYDAQPEWAEKGRQVLCDANTEQAIQTMFRDVTKAEELYEIIRQAIHMKLHPVAQVEEAFKSHSGLAKRIIAGLDLSKPETSLNAALCLDQASSRPGELLSTQLKRFPEEWAIQQAFEALPNWASESVKAFIRTMAEIRTPEASQFVFNCVRRIDEKPLGRYAIEQLAASPYEGVATPIVKIAQRVNAELQGVQALIALRDAAEGADEKRALSKAMLPLIMTLAAPDNVHRVAARVKREGLSELGAVFATVDQERIVPGAKAGYFIGLFENAVRQDDVRRRQKAAHKALLGRLDRDAAP